MKISDIYFIIRNRLFTKDNLFFYLINIFTILSIFICITIINFSLDFKLSNYDIFDTRVLFVSMADDDKLNDKIKDIEHVTLVESKKYAQPAYVTTDNFYVDSLDSEITLKPMLIDDVKIFKGQDIKNNNEIICPERFYPYSIYVTNKNGEFEKMIDKKHIIKANTLIGKSIKVLNYDDDNYSLKVVGTYKNIKLEGSNTCYISKESFDLFKSNYEVCSDDGCKEYNSFMVLVDDYKNMSYVESELSKLGLSSIRQVSFDDVLFNQLIAIPSFVGSIVIVLSITILYAFIRKKSKNDRKEQAILKSLGYKEKDIIKIYKSELSVCYFISSIISFVIYIIIFSFVYNNYFDEFKFFNYLIPIPYLYFLISLILLYFYFTFVIDTFTKSNYKLCVRKLFEE